VEEYNGYLALTNEEHQRMDRIDAGFPKYARELFIFGENYDGYWTNELLMRQVRKAAAIALIKYPKETHTVLWVFDRSSGHNAYNEDALIASRMNVTRGKFSKQSTAHNMMCNIQFPSGTK
jgi:hypothetical protein